MLIDSTSEYHVNIK